MTDFARQYRFDPTTPYEQQNRVDRNEIQIPAPELPIGPEAAAFVPAKSYSNAYGTGLLPYEFTGWRDESLAWHLTCSIHAGLNPSPTVLVRGPQAADFLRENLVCNVDKWPIGASKHGLMLLEDGTVACQGLAIRTGEQEYEVFWMSPFLNYRFSLKQWDAEVVDVSGQRSLFQMQGPKSFDILNEACGESIADIAFLRSREAKLGDWTVRILRFGMGNSLGYEVHCDAADAPYVYKRILEVGAPYGIRPMGSYAYEMNHTPGGSQQDSTHFVSSAFEDEGYCEFFNEYSGGLEFPFILGGSMGTDVRDRYANPIELGLGKAVNWDHEFVGKEALLKYKENPKRNLKTLVWNPEDIVDIHRSQFTDDPYCEMEQMAREMGAYGMPVFTNDKVLDLDGNEIGMSGGRIMDAFHHEMLSLAIMDLEFCEEGTQVQVVWGEPGTRQKLIRATVAPVPYNTHLENRTLNLQEK